MLYFLNHKILVLGKLSNTLCGCSGICPIEVLVGDVASVINCFNSVCVGCLS